jgi:hypothetical protein
MKIFTGASMRSAAEEFFSREAAKNAKKKFVAA